VDPSSPAVGNVQAAWTSPTLDGAVYAQPLVVGTSVIVATENDSVYAFDAATGAERWMRHLATPVSGSALPCGNVDPSGITGTPVADAATGTLWVVTFSSPAVHTLWGLDLSTGAVTSSRNADAPGADARAEQQRGALAILGTRVYVPYGGLFGDCSDYHGWVVGLSTAEPSSGTKLTWETPAARAGIWAPPGLVTSNGSLFVATGNGDPIDQIGYSDSVVRLSSALAVQDSFTPRDFAHLSANDLDLGSTSPAILPGGLVFQIGKDGVGYLLEANHLGGSGGDIEGVSVCGEGMGGDAVDGNLVVVSCTGGLYAIRVTPPTGSTGAQMTVAWAQTSVRPGPPVVAGGEVWDVDRDGAVVGLSLTTGAVQYRHAVTVAGSFPSLSAAGGRLFVPDGDQLMVLSGA
jgi:outer membrane protein assembly factor BamB